MTLPSYSMLHGTGAAKDSDALAVLKQHIADETAESISGVQFLFDTLTAQWALSSLNREPFETPSVS